MALSIDAPAAHRAPLALFAWLTAAVLLAALVAREGFTLVTVSWFTRPEYSHGLLIPFIAAFLVWRRRDLLGERPPSGSWLGAALTAAGLGLWLLGSLSTIYAVSQYALVAMVHGIVLSVVGPKIFVRLWAPLLMLVLMIPLPEFLYANLSSELQLVSSGLGVWFMRLCDISVYLSGNVIDLGHFQMQVVEACDGLRYLFPLMTLGFIVAYFFQGAPWQRLVIFLSSIPITVVMNSLRIAIIGAFAEYGNTSLAEGLLHDLQGWVIFMASGALLLGETWLLTALFMRGRSWRDALGFDRAGVAPRPAPSAGRVPSSLVTSAVALAATAVLSYTLPERAEARPQRAWFVDFPLELEGWSGRHGRLDEIYVNALSFDDYLLADYTKGAELVNLYVAYYGSQRQGESIHSPRSCIPGGGWRITEFDRVAVPDGGGTLLEANRALIELGAQRQLVYYWFKQRERHLTNEYAVKWFIFLDALTRRRSDGALVRLVTPLPPGEDVRAADERLQSFARAVHSRIGAFVPD